MNKRIACVLLVLVLCFAFIGQNICVVDAAINTTTFNTKVQEFIKDSRWENGVSWGDNQTPKLSKWSSIGCCAYAADFVAYVYGSTTAAWTASGFTKFTNLNEIRVGDIIHITGHWFVVIERNGNNLKTVEGNFDDKVRVSSDGWGIKDGKLHNLKASSSECTFEYGYHYNFSDSSSNTNSSSQIYYNIDMSSSVLASRTNQQVSSDCAVVSMVTVESYLYGAKTAAGKNAVYKALVNKNGDDNYAYWSNCGYVSHSSVNWATVYEQLSIGYPVIVHRPATSSNSQHWAVVAGYKGSTTKLEKDKFIIVDVYHGSGSKDIYTSAEWRGSVAIDRMVTRKNGISITSLTGIRIAIDHPATVHQNGAGHGVLGYITSNENLLSVTVTVTNANTGANVYNKTITPNAKSYLIYNLDSEMTFAKWAVGEYFFTVVAKTAEQTRAYQSYFQITKGWPLSLPKRSYNFNFNNNGGSGNVTSQLVYYGDKLTIPTTTPTRNGYKFVGWTVVRSTDNTSYYSKGEWLSNNQAGSSDAKKIYKPGDVYSINYDWVKGSFTNRNYTFYAVWETDKPVTYTISYNANGGTGAPSSQTKTHGQSMSLSNLEPVRSGHTFIGWANTSNATVATYKSGDEFKTDANTTLYAVWKVNAVSEKPKFVVDNLVASGGDTVEVKISFKNNPGIASVKLSVAFDSLLTLEKITYNKDLNGMAQQPQSLNSPVTLNWFNGAGNTEGDIVFATLTFKVGKTAKSGDVANISVSYEPNNIYRIAEDFTEELIDFEIVNGSISVLSHTPGDINNDGMVDNRDITRLFQYLSNWDVIVNESALDVNGDSVIDNRDLTRLFQYLSNWDVKIY